MKLMTWNVRGLGRSEKKRAVRRLISKRRCDILFIQESKIEVVTPRLQRFLTGHGSLSGEFVSSVGVAGGLISVWDEQFFTVEEKVSTCRYILLVGTIKSKNFRCGLGNIYAPNDIEKGKIFG